jgi:hypothetical protein
MATLDASKWGRLGLVGQTSHTAARDGTTSNVTSVNPTFSTSAAISYVRSSGRTGSIYSIYRTFYYFDTSGITCDITDSSLNIMGASAETAAVIIVRSTAFGGDGIDDLISTDYDNITFDTSYGLVFNTWDDGLNNEVPFNNNTDPEGTANAAIRDDDYFICAVIEYAYDYRDIDPSSNVANTSGINFSVDAYLNYTLGPANVLKVNGLLTPIINKWDGTSWCDVVGFNGVS